MTATIDPATAEPVAPDHLLEAAPEPPRLPPPPAKRPPRDRSRPRGRTRTVSRRDVPPADPDARIEALRRRIEYGGYPTDRQVEMAVHRLIDSVLGAPDPSRRT
jgi:hypothetical protein